MGIRPAFVALMLVLSVSIHAADWYFSGDVKSNTAGTMKSNLFGMEALKEKLSAAKPGDRFFLLRGDVFYGTLDFSLRGSVANPVTLAAYGEGAAPIITDLTAISGWKPAGKNLWKAKIALSAGTPAMLLKNGVQLALGRYPNADAPWGGYLPITKHEGKTGIESAELTGSPGWKGAEVVLRSRRWILDRIRVARQEGATLVLETGSTYEPYDGFGFFLQDHPAALDVEGEWCFDRGTGEILLYSALDPGRAAYEYPSGGTLADFGGSSFLSIQGIEFRGSNRTILDFTGSNGMIIRTCVFSSAGKDAVSAWNPRDATVEGCEFRDAQNCAFKAAPAAGLRLIGNRFMRTALMAGMGAGADGQYNAIDVAGERILIEGNTVEKTGYLPIAFSGDDIMVRRNLVDGYALVKDDAGGIYTWSDGKKPGKNRAVVENVVRNGIGAPDGQSWPWKAVQGIYMDDHTSGVRIEGNLVYGVGESGILIHNAHDLQIKGNILFDNSIQMQFAHDSIAPEDPVKNVVVEGNVLYAANEEQILVRIQNWGDDEEPEPAFAGNIYASPFVHDAQFVLQPDGRALKLVDLDEWIAPDGRDPRGTAVGRFIPPFKETRTVGGNLIKNGTFDQGLSGWGWWATYGAGTAAAGSMAPAGKGNIPSARLSFLKTSGMPDSLFLFHSSPFPVEKGRRYRLRFTARSSRPGLVLSFLTRRSSDPWTQSSAEYAFELGTDVEELERYFVSETTEPFTRAEFILKEEGMPSGAPISWVYAEIADIELFEVEMSRIDTDSLLHFFPNVSNASMEIDLEGNFIDALGKRASGKIVIPPFSAGIFLKEGSAP